MDEKNRFSRLLDFLMNTAQIKKYILAHELQYDVSYISKWVNGKLIPSEKTEKKVLSGISHCITHSSTEEGISKLLEYYQVNDTSELEMAIYDNLTTEYHYEKEQQTDSIPSSGDRICFFADLPIEKYISKMHHPVLRRVNSLDIMASMDLMSMKHEYRLQIITLEAAPSNNTLVYPNVHFSLVIHIDVNHWDTVYDTIFLINILDKMRHIDFSIYESPHSHDRAIFAVKDDFAISGLLVDHDKCMSVITTEEKSACNTIYHHIKKLCSMENMLFTACTMKKLLLNNGYIRSLLVPNPCWIMGHMTEIFLSDDLFTELYWQLHEIQEEVISFNETFRIHESTKNLLEKAPVRLIFYENAFSDFAISGELDFYNHKCTLTPEQRVDYIKHLLKIFDQNENLQIRLLYDKLSSDFHYHSTECVLLSDTLSYLRLGNDGERNKIMILNHRNIQTIFTQFFEDIWKRNDDIVISDMDCITGYIQHIMQGTTSLSPVSPRST